MKKTRAEAIAANQKQYNTGKPCKHGHFSLRDTATAECVECRKQWGRNERDKIKAIRKQLAGQ